jgi:hypothetical protein
LDTLRYRARSFYSLFYRARYAGARYRLAQLLQRLLRQLARQLLRRFYGGVRLSKKAAHLAPFFLTKTRKGVEKGNKKR